MSDRPPQPPLTEAERDAILRELRAGLGGFNLLANEVKRQGRVQGEHQSQLDKHSGLLGEHEKRIATIETQVLAGVHAAPADPSIPVFHAEPLPDHLSLPPMRAPMSTHEQLHALTMEQEKTAQQTAVLDKKQDDQTSMLQKMGAQQRQALAVFIGAILMAMVNQCQPATIQSWMPHRTAPVLAPAPAPAPVTTPPSPAPSR